jgi:putative ABC transport system permease protein
MSITRDLRAGARVSLRAPLVSAGAILCIALGIGSTTALFSMLEQLVLRPMPYPESSALVLLRASNRAQGLPDAPVAVAEFDAWRQAARSFESMVAYQPGTVSLSGTEVPERVDAMRISEGYFETLRTTPIFGRTMTASDARPGSAPTAVIGETLWHRQFGGDPAIVGRAITLNGRAVTVIGIMPAAFRDPFAGKEGDCWLPLWFDNAALQSPAARSLLVIARLRAGLSLDAARAEMHALAGAIAGAGGAGGGTVAAAASSRNAWDVEVVRPEEVFAGGLRTPAMMLFAAALLVLFIACLNVATLLLARAAGRTRELGLRLTLGATRGHLARQLGLETLVLVVPGALGGLAWAVVLQRLLISLRPAFLGRLDTIGLNPSVLVVAILCTALTTVLCTFLPLLHALRVPAQQLLHAGTPGVIRDTPLRASLHALIVVEIAVSVLLLVMATMVTRDLLDRWPREQVAWSDKLTIRVTMPVDRYPTADQRLAYIRVASDQLATLPGVSAVTQASIVPYDRYMLGAYLSSSTSHDETFARTPSVGYAAVGATYFQTLGIRPIEGRLPTEQDTRGAPGAFVVTQSLAARVWPGRSAIGQPMSVTVFNPTGSLRGDVKRDGTVVGVVADIRNPSDAEAQQLQVYVPIAQHTLTFVRFVVSAPHVEGLVRDARARLAKADPTIVPDEAMTLEAMLGQRLELNRFYAVITQLFAAIGFTLAAVGVYAVTSYMMRRRWFELGIRSALGASPAQLFAELIRHGLIIVIVGLGIGSVAAVAGRRLLASLVATRYISDPTSYALAAAAVALAAAVAILSGATRVARVDPMQGLRDGVEP